MKKQLYLAFLVGISVLGCDVTDKMNSPPTYTVDDGRAFGETDSEGRIEFHAGSSVYAILVQDENGNGLANMHVDFEAHEHLNRLFIADPSNIMRPVVAFVDQSQAIQQKVGLAPVAAGTEINIVMVAAIPEDYFGDFAQVADVLVASNAVWDRLTGRPTVCLSLAEFFLILAEYSGSQIIAAIYTLGPPTENVANVRMNGLLLFYDRSQVSDIELRNQGLEMFASQFQKLTGVDVYESWIMLSGMDSLKENTAGEPAISMRLDDGSCEAEFGSLAPDTVPPQTFIEQAPSGTVDNNDIAIVFRGTDDVEVVGFQCKMTSATAPSGSWEACTSPMLVEDLADNHYFFSVRAIDHAGNIDPSPASVNWIVQMAPIDVTPPETILISAPDSLTNQNFAQFEFTCSEVFCDFECRIDEMSWFTCTSPLLLESLDDGDHLLEIRSIDSALNMETSPVTAQWSQDTLPPEVLMGPTINGGAAVTTRQLIEVTFVVSGASHLRISERLDFLDTDWQPVTSVVQMIIAIPAGQKTIYVQFRDMANNYSSIISESVELDLTPPPYGSTVSIPAGCYLRGDHFDEGDPIELPVHTVCVSAFEMDVFHVTTGQYAECVSEDVCSPPAITSSETRLFYYGNPEYADYPVVRIDWESAQEYCNWKGGRLPWEGEWEYVARNGLEGKRYTFGNTLECAHGHVLRGASIDPCWNFNELDNQDTVPGGNYMATVYGVHDMVSNLFVWNGDILEWYSPGTFTDPTGTEPPGAVAGRGGGRRVSWRTGASPSSSGFFTGFRCVY